MNRIAGRRHPEDYRTRLRALERGFTVRFCALPTSLADLMKQESIPPTERRLRRYTSPDLLVLDSC